MKNREEQHRTVAATATPLAIVGIGSLFPRASDTGTFWSNIKNGTDAITEVPETHWRSDDYFDPNPKSPDKVYAKCGGFLAPVDFNPLEYGILPNALEAIDTSQLLGLIAVEQALRDAGYTTQREFDRDRVSVILGVTGTLELVVPLGARLGHPRWREALRDAGIADALADDVMQRISDSYVPWQENSFPGLLGNVVAGRISKHFNFGGTNCVCDAACGSSLSALNLAALELETGRADMVVTGGIDTFNDIFMYTCFSKTPALSPSGHARPFDAASDGTTLGEGLGIVVIKRLADAERDGDKIYAVIKGIGASSDGKGAAIYEPSAAGQQKALRRAYAAGGIDPATIELIEAHGTGTRVGDAVEVNALRGVFGEADTPWCALGSIKSQIGHTKAAAGAAGLIKAALALHHKTLPPTIKVKTPQEAVTKGRSPFYVNTEPRPWVTRGDHPRRAGISALGFGGSNFHCLLEEHGPHKVAADWQGDVQIAAFSAADEAQLEAAIEAFPVGGSWDELRLAADLGRQAFDPQQPCRLALVLERNGKPAAQLKTALAMLRSQRGKSAWQTPDGSFFASDTENGPLAILFPGQGAQYPGMLRDLATQFPQFLQAFAEADRAFAVNSNGGERLVDLVYPRPAFDQAGRERAEEQLRATEVAQPALGAVSLGARAVLADFGVDAEVFAGHSYGELTALCAAGFYDADALHALSRLRGELMAAGEGDRGSMLAVSAPLDRIEAFLTETGLNLVLANRNTPEQGVLSGATAEIERAVALLEERGMRGKRLAVAAAFHSELVADASGPFGDRLQAIAFSKPTAKVFANSTGQAYPATAGKARELLASQISRPVEFVAEIEAMYAVGIRTFLEVGPGARLTGMVKAILGDRPHQAVAIDASGGKRSGIHDLGRALAQLAALGYPVALDRWDAGYAAARQSTAAKKPGMTVPLCGANYFKPPQKRPALPPQAAAVATPGQPPQAASANPQLPKTGAPAAPVAVSFDSGTLQQALSLTQQSILALQQLQEQTSRLHEQFLVGQESATRSFLNLVEQQNRLLRGEAPPVTQNIAATPQVRSAAAATVPQPQHETIKPETPAAVTVPSDTSAPVIVAAPVADSGRVTEVLLAVIAEKTGYPVEMLELEMALDTDLGIDSIKRVEILSALQEQLPEAPAVKPEDLGSLQTLGQIVAHLGAGMAPSAAAVAVPAAPVADSGRVTEVLLAVIAEKTGYPVEMLELEMALDTDLGIDSIKRVEILSALQEQLPEAPAVKPEDLGSLQTLGQIVAHLSTVVTVKAAPSGAAVQAAEPVDRKAVADALLAVVAEKTGYPVEMLELEMALDTDLGIDSIKRVEILSALQERLPAAPAVKPEHLGTLQTLGQIVDFLASVSGAVESAAPPSAPPLVSKVGTGVERQILKLVPLPAVAEDTPCELAAGAPFWVTEEGSELTAAVCRELERYKLSPIVIVPGDAPKDVPGNLAGLLLLAPSAGADDAFLQQAFLLVQQAESVLSATADRRAALLAGVSRLDGCFGLGRGPSAGDVLSGGLAGLVKTAGHEWKKVQCKALDLASGLDDVVAAARRLVAELFTDGPSEVGLTATGRSTLKLVDAPLSKAERQSPVAYGDVVVLSGGARGVTAEAAVALAASRATLLLLGRSPAPTAEPDWLAGLEGDAAIKKAVLSRATGPLKPKEVEQQCREILANREVLGTLRRIKQAGGQAVYRSVDLRDADAVAVTLSEVREEYGPIRGLVHGAGVLADRLIRDKTLEQFDQVYGTKVDGLRHLLAATAQDDMRFMVFFSSSTGRFGRTGQVDYAVANEVLNKLAQAEARRRPDCRVVSLNWGPWDGGMVTPALKKVFEQEGVAVIGLQDGAAYLADEIATAAGGPVEIVVLGGRETAQMAEESQSHENIYVSKAFDLELSIDQYPFLKSHVIDGKAVLPMAVIIEWMAHGALHNNPGLKFHGFNDLRVLKGVTLESGQSHTLQVMTGKAFKSDGVHVVPVELSGVAANGRQHVHARARMVLAARLPEGKVATERLELPVYAHPPSEFYRPERLFHGPDFHGIREVIGCAAEGITSLVRPAPRPAEWINQPLRNAWLTDPLALDSSFQMMILWSFERYKAGSLPVFAGRYRQYRDRFPDTGAEIRIRVTRQSASKAAAEIDFVDAASGALIARIEDYECVIDASLNASFQRNKLQGAA